MKVVKIAVAGTLESSDALIRVSPAEDVDIEINSIVKEQFGEDILKTTNSILNDLNIDGVKIIIDDKGALDCVLRARIKAALSRAIDEKISWEKLV
ncbi:citrate lyase acyl carrier protein [Otariodibacter sp.]|uniref:citrate lyase acyl carrier protein n=1 Tax=Otariodibacter sp. TaxID=3030919 RepID=UPI00260851D1|nr:citrate lyase acyl carrier protein [Otariodibacter sp.]